MNLSNCESVKGAFYKIMGFAGKRFLFSPPLPLPVASISVALAPIFAQPKSEKRLQRAESLTETLATQAKNINEIVTILLIERWFSIKSTVWLYF